MEALLEREYLAQMCADLAQLSDNIDFANLSERVHSRVKKTLEFGVDKEEQINIIRIMEDISKILLVLQKYQQALYEHSEQLEVK